MRTIIIAATLVASVTAAAADWRIPQERDRMTDKTVKWATVTTKSDSGVTGTLMLTCLVHDLVGGYHINMRTDRAFTRGNMALRYRFDDEPVEDRIGPDNTARNGMDGMVRPDEVRDAKRIRVEIRPASSAALHFDFNATGLRKAFEAVPCKNTRRVN